MILPVIAVLMGACLDGARAYEVMLKLQAATRDAAEYAALNATTSAAATTQAKGIVCVQFGLPATCTQPPINPASQPTVVTTFSSSTTTGGGTATKPAVTVTVTSSSSFKTLVPLPFIPPSGLSLSSSATYRVLQGR